MTETFHNLTTSIAVRTGAKVKNRGLQDTRFTLSNMKYTGLAQSLASLPTFTTNVKYPLFLLEWD